MIRKRARRRARSPFANHDRTPEAERGLAIGTLSGSWDVGVVIGSLIIGVTVERASYAAGFLVAGVSSILGLTAFVVTERRRVRARPRVLDGTPHGI